MLSANPEVSIAAKAAEAVFLAEAVIWVIATESPISDGANARRLAIAKPIQIVSPNIEFRFM